MTKIYIVALLVGIKVLDQPTASVLISVPNTVKVCLFEVLTSYEIIQFPNPEEHSLNV